MKRVHWVNSVFIPIVLFFILQGCEPREPNTSSNPCLEKIKQLSPDPQESPSPTVEAPPKPTVMIILDASGSMKYPVSKTSNKAKIVEAKSVISDIVNDPFLESLTLGFAALGHLTQTCEDNVEIIQNPIDKKPNKEILDSLAKINVKSYTPLAKAIQLVGTELLKIRKNNNQKIVIILVTDGFETCKGNPQQEVQKLKKDGLSFVFHVVGYGGKVRDIEELKKLAAAGGGKYFNSSNVKELRKNLDESIYGFGQFKLIKPESDSVQGWRLYEENSLVEEDDAAIEVNRQTRSDEMLWKPQNVLAGNYNFCILFKEGEKKEALVKRVKITRDTTTSVDLRDLAP